MNPFDKEKELHEVTVELPMFSFDELLTIAGRCGCVIHKTEEESFYLFQTHQPRNLLSLGSEIGMAWIRKNQSKKDQKPLKDDMMDHGAY